MPEMACGDANEGARLLWNSLLPYRVRNPAAFIRLRTRYRLTIIGGAEEDRTPDLCSAIAALSQLSYGP